MKMKVVYRRHIFYIYCLVTTIFSFALFLKCYFPLKQGLSGNTRAENVPDEPISGRKGVPDRVYDRLVLMVIDGLRSDFVLGDISYMPFTQKLLRDGQGVAFAAKTHLPTVTLPRIKAMTSGSIPGFVDVVLNFGSSALTDDNLLTQLKLAGKMLTFFGDDTWLRLFPDHFKRTDGTTSFIVTDYTEVDLNVTRHLKEELAAEDWQVMVLHYLGLDHLGHLYAPEPSLFMPKLREMDAVVQQIFSAMSSWTSDKPAALVICGDHGISDQGGHGGASLEETSIPIVLLSPHTTFQPPSAAERVELQQIDMCPTLSALMGLPIPRNNLGRVEVTALPFNTPIQDRVRHLQLNAAQMLDILAQNVGNLEEDQAYHLYQDALAAHTSWLSSQNSSSSTSWESVGRRVLMGYQDVVLKMSQRVGQSSTTYDMYGIGVAIVCLWMNLLVQSQVLMCNGAAESLRLQTGSVVIVLPVFMAAMLSHVTVCTSQHSSDILCGTSVISLVVQLVMLVILFVSAALLGRLAPFALRNIFGRHTMSWNCWELVLAGSSILHSLSLVSSSFVEEEHQTWYFFASSLHTLLLLLPLCHLTPPFSHSTKPEVSVSSRTALMGLSVKSEVAQSSHPHHGDKISTATRSWNSLSGHSSDLNCLKKGAKNFIGTDAVASIDEVNRLEKDGHSRSWNSLTGHSSGVNFQKREVRNVAGTDIVDTDGVSHVEKDGDGWFPSWINEEQKKNRGSRSLCQTKEEESWGMSMGESVWMVGGLSGILVLCRVLRRWNQTGNKWMDVPDVGDWLVRPENKLTLSVLVALSLSCLVLTRVTGMSGKIRPLLLVAALASVYLSKAASGTLLLPAVATSYLSAQGVVEARCAYLFILCLLIHYLRWPFSLATPANHVSSSPSTSRNTSPPSSTNHNTSPVSSTNHNTSSLSSANQNPGSTHPSHKSVHESHLTKKSPFCQQSCDSHLMSQSSVEDGRDDSLTVSVMRERHKGLWEGAQVVWLCVMCLLLRPHNVALVVMVSVVEKLACRFVLPYVLLRPWSSALYCWLMGQASFFFQGNSNSLSTVDVSVGPTALYDYQPVIFALQITMATYAGLIFWLLSSFKFITIATPLHNFQHRLSEAYTELCSTVLVTRAVPLAVYTVLVTVMRYHLFVWTVFSPKLLYEGQLTLVASLFCVACLLMAHTLRNTAKEKV